MPHHPKEEETSSHITDQVAKESSDSTASSHEMHQGETGATSGGKATIEDHKATPGPVMSQGLGEPKGKDELKARAEELNK
ncbi:hypothetical protein BT93_L0003 [Corymbia citriodora subsp. variegata]|uniref:Uncharacterized protein n=1 Tax=Corymbia citriodora subsp. variegata TaxID=360336 RepID=A0A8T0CEZ1_CORYI|nr:hypothetical protein BT93_L0003 [Corymbia citriodora subsp. variegata]